MTNARLATVAEVIAFFKSQSKTVLTFVGYSGSGYEHKAAMLATAADVLADYDPATTVVNSGATAAGIGAIYPLALHKGFQTTGIVSTQAQVHGVSLSPDVQQVFYIEDSTWGGFVGNSEQLSPTSAAVIAVSDIMIGIGGGEIVRDELLAARQAGKRVKFFSADMNHRRALTKAVKGGLPHPVEFKGAASTLFCEN